MIELKCCIPFLWRDAPCSFPLQGEACDCMGALFCRHKANVLVRLKAIKDADGNAGFQPAKILCSHSFIDFKCTCIRFTKSSSTCQHTVILRRVNTRRRRAGWAACTEGCLRFRKENCENARTVRKWTTAINDRDYGQGTVSNKAGIGGPSAMAASVY